jgi:hypothetical protein
MFRMAVAAVSEGMPIAQRVALVGPLLNAEIDEFDRGECKDGVQTFQERLLETIEKGFLSDWRWVSVLKAGVHPENRDGAGLVPIDVHDLLLRISQNGWSWGAVDALACEIPPTDVGDKWRAFNEQLARESDGLLPPANSDQMQIVTVRGSHTTASVRIYAIPGVKGIHEKCCLDGHVSKSKIVELQPSMEEPCAKGLRYQVVRWELVVACPRLMEVLSRTGNAGHGVARVATILQGCNRVHAMAMQSLERSADASINYDAVAEQAAVGMDPGYVEVAKSLCEFVRAWSGGRDGHILKSLESYERSLTVKRKLNHLDLRQLAKLDMAEAPRYVQALVKAMLNSPGSMVSPDGIATTFGNSDFASLQPNGRNRANAMEANAIMQSFSAFTKAYSRCAEHDLIKCTSDLEVRAVMHVHQKKAESRANFASLLHVAAHVYDAVKAADDKLPSWPLLAPLGAERATKKPKLTGVIREISEDEISVSVLAEKGFAVGVQVVKIGVLPVVAYTISSMDDKVTLTIVVAEGDEDDEDCGDDDPKVVTKQELYAQWALWKAAVDEVAHLCTYMLEKQIYIYIYIYICIDIFIYL